MASARDDFVYRVARRIAAARIAKGLTQEGLAAILGIATKNLQRIEGGRQNLSLKTLEKISTALGVTAEQLLGVTPPKAESPLDRLADAGLRVRAATERGRRPAWAVPVTTLRAAAGRLAGGARAIEILGWVGLPRRPIAPADQFVAEIRGRSMEPGVPDRALGLFAPPGTNPAGVVLVSHDSLADDELGGPYAVKRIKSSRRLRDGRIRTVLESSNRSFAPIVVVAPEGELRVIAELVRVLA